MRFVHCFVSNGSNGAVEKLSHNKFHIATQALFSSERHQCRCVSFLRLNVFCCLLHSETLASADVLGRLGNTCTRVENPSMQWSSAMKLFLTVVKEVIS
jgi:hypothetical protein